MPAKRGGVDEHQQADRLESMSQVGRQESVADPFTRVPLDAHTIKPERLNLAARQRTNPFPWRGQFSPELIELLLSTYGPRRGTVLDPFVGVGTTLWEAARRGLDAIGTEINPAAATMAASVRFVPLCDSERRIALASARSRLADVVGNWSAGPLFSSQAATGLTGEGIKRALAEMILATPCDLERIALENTLLRAMESSTSDPGAHVYSSFKAYADAVMSLPSASSRIAFHHADARRIPTSASTIDLVLTSPPYINVFNYHQCGRVAMEALGWNLLSVARSEFGANRKHRGNRFLTVVQYALDMTQWLAEMRRVLAPAARMIVIIGRESTVRGISFKNGVLLAALAESCGYSLATRQERQFVTRYGELIVEDILHFRRGADPACDVQTAARCIAVSFLSTALQREPIGDVATDLRTAIAQAPAVRPSPIMQHARPICQMR